MLCENCNKNEASVLIQQMINGKSMELHICQECATKTYMDMSFDNLFQGFLNSLINNNGFNKDSQKDTKEIKKCPICGSTFDEISRLGKIGCSECYVAFSQELLKIIKNIQGSDTHLGKYPSKAGADIILDKKLSKLRKELKEKIAMEDYEDAARIRDEIKASEGGE